MHGSVCAVNSHQKNREKEQSFRWKCAEMNWRRKVQNQWIIKQFFEWELLLEDISACVYSKCENMKIMKIANCVVNCDLNEVFEIFYKWLNDDIMMEWNLWKFIFVRHQISNWHYHFYSSLTFPLSLFDWMSSYSLHNLTVREEKNCHCSSKFIHRYHLPRQSVDGREREI